MARSNKKRPSGKLSPFAQARAQANFLLDIAFSPEPPNFEAVRIGRRTMRVDDVRTELNAARARVESQFDQPSMGADAIRNRLNAAAEDVEKPFTVMAGKL
ncbi:hypothetical protein [Cupriavidus oxalaticus]|uniref:hypothetical protein n=1 Tax=Cupriavidus oxalaticus TaxID=96344 RepID=UPI00316DC387